ncbi:hypothetical protein TNCV_1045261 [Trichonephila clavipes]|nr:hypothetical protein TNCV_1045261 [Trichonephila clavipes]
MPTSAIKDLSKKWDAIRTMVLEWHPNQADVSRRDVMLSIRDRIHSRPFPEEDITTPYSGFEPKPTRLEAQGHIHHTTWSANYAF